MRRKEGKEEEGRKKEKEIKRRKGEEEGNEKGRKEERKCLLHITLLWEAAVFIFGIIIKSKAFLRLYTHPLKLERVTILLAQFCKMQVVMISLLKKGKRKKPPPKRLVSLKTSAQ